MPIELNRLRGRKQVTWLGGMPPTDVKRVFEEREYLATPCTDLELQDSAFLAGLSAVVFTQSAEKPLRIAKELEKHARHLLDYDCRIILRPAPNGLSILINVIDQLEIPTVGLPLQEAEKLSKWQNPKDGNPPLPYVRYFDESIPWSTVANFIAESPPGAAPNHALNIKIEDRVDSEGKRHKSTLRAQSTLLLQRAFWDCKDLHLVPMDEGYSGVGVYRACAELTGGLHGQWPQPHFVKIGKRGKIFAEYKIYEENVDPYVPFHLGPHLVRERCCLGANEGAIVGDYVEESESLRNCACDGRSASAIACLFDRTLLGWHRQAHEVSIPLSAGLLDQVPQKIDEQRMKRARQLGATRDLLELRSLFELCISTPVLVGPIHGDLHAANVRVRAADAIVIDFFKHRSDYPLLYDAATLEASLLVEGFANDDRDAQEWLDSLEPLYDYPPLDRGVTQANPKNRSFWFHACVQQIRRYARQWECGRGQYAGALAVALLRRASYDPSAPEREASRLAAAYVLAERVLSKTFGTQPAAGTPAVAS
jgi:hypothetical protein